MHAILPATGQALLIDHHALSPRESGSPASVAGDAHLAFLSWSHQDIMSNMVPTKSRTALGWKAEGWHAGSIPGSGPTWWPRSLVENSFSVWGLGLAKSLATDPGKSVLERCTLQRARVPFLLEEQSHEATDRHLRGDGGWRTLAGGRRRPSRTTSVFEVGCATSCNPRFLFHPRASASSGPAAQKTPSSTATTRTSKSDKPRSVWFMPGETPQDEPEARAHFRPPVPEPHWPRVTPRWS